MKTKTILFVLLFSVSPSFGQQKDTLNLSVQNCIEMALENNIELRNSQLEIDKAKTTKKEAETAYFPTVTAQALAFDALNPMLSFGIDDIENAQVRQILYTLYAEYGAQLGLKKSIPLCKTA